LTGRSQRALETCRSGERRGQETLAEHIRAKYGCSTNSVQRAKASSKYAGHKSMDRRAILIHLLPPTEESRSASRERRSESKERHSPTLAIRSPASERRSPALIVRSDASDRRSPAHERNLAALEFRSSRLPSRSRASECRLPVHERNAPRHERDDGVPARPMQITPLPATAQTRRSQRGARLGDADDRSCRRLSG